MLKKFIAVAVLAVPFIASASQLPDYPFIHASGNGLVLVAPDVGEVDFEILSQQDDPEAARCSGGKSAMRATMPRRSITT